MHPASVRARTARPPSSARVSMQVDRGEKFQTMPVRRVNRGLTSGGTKESEMKNSSGDQIVRSVGRWVDVRAGRYIHR